MLTSMLRPPSVTRQFPQLPFSLVRNHSFPLRPLLCVPILRPFSTEPHPRIWTLNYHKPVGLFACSIRCYSVNSPLRPSPSSPSRSRPQPTQSNVQEDGLNPSTAVHGGSLGHRKTKYPWKLVWRRVFSWEFLLKTIYRWLLVIVVIYPILVFSGGPIKLNHLDGEYEAFELVSRKEVAKDHYELLLKRKVFLASATSAL